MMIFNSKSLGTGLVAGLFLITQADRALCADASPEKSQALLQKVKQGELDRRISLKQTEIDRLKEDLEKSKKDMDALRQNSEATSALITESTGNLDQLAIEQKHLEEALDLAEVRIEAERRKIEGLKSLSVAQSSALDALTAQTTEIDTRSHVREAEMQLLSQGKPVPGEDNDENGSPEMVKLKKTLASNENKTAAAEKIARKEMKTATARLASAEEAAARAKRMADGLNKEAPAPVAEKVEDAAPEPAAAPSATNGAKGSKEKQ